jgi:aspartyl-tRNA(Asn)/glutamyl-tRNA(Gln) amidotransferase subunit C
MSLSREDVLALGLLARIGMDDAEVERMRHDLDTILGFVDRLQKVDTTGVEEDAPPAVLADAYRADEVYESDDVTREFIFQNFPGRQGDLLKAPAVFEAPKR